MRRVFFSLLAVLACMPAMAQYPGQVNPWDLIIRAQVMEAYRAQAMAAYRAQVAAQADDLGYSADQRFVTDGTPDEWIAREPGTHPWNSYSFPNIP